MSLTEFLATTLLFKDVNVEILSLVAEKLTAFSLPAHETMIQEGTHSDSLYLLQTGKLEIFLRDQAENDILISTLFPGYSVGEIGLLTGALRTATVRAAETSQLWQLTRQAFEQIAQGNPTLYSTVEAAVVERLQRAHLRKALYNNRLFEKLDVSIIPDFEHALDLVSLPAGETLFYAEDASDALYIVVSGCLRLGADFEPIDSETGSPPREIGTGQIVGELGVITGNPRRATIEAVRETLLGRLDADAYYRLLRQYPKDILQSTSDRIATDYLSGATRRVGNQHSVGTIAVFALGDDVPLTAFAQQLTEALTQYGKALHINDTLTNHMLGQPEIAYTPVKSAAGRRLTFWFGDQEARYDYVVYSSNKDLTQSINETGFPDRTEHLWAEHCAQRADHILYVAWADGKAQAMTIAPELSMQRSLVLLHPTECQIPTGTQLWLDVVKSHWHHHLRWSATSTSLNGSTAHGDMSRLARLLTGRGNGLVLSGGGARGYAHVGAIRALEEAGIPIDLVGGTSMGAIVAGLSAIGHNADSMMALLVDYIGDRKHLTDYTLPITSLLSGQKLETVMSTLFGNTDIVDTWCNFFCISTDITRAAEVVHRSGPMWRYVRASMSLPGAFPPQVDGDNLLVDGCFMNNYPANIMYNANGCGTVIGVNACGKLDLHDKNQYGNSLSGWAILNSKFNPFSKPIIAPGIFETILRLADLSTVDRSQQQRQLTDLFIRPPVEPYGSYDFEKHGELIDVGYRAAQSAIHNWLAKEFHDKSS